MAVEIAESSPSAEDAHHQPTQPHLAKQDAAALDPTKLTALTPEVVRAFTLTCLGRE
jgi:hypothetical protein